MANKKSPQMGGFSVLGLVPSSSTLLTVNLPRELALSERSESKG